MLTAGLCAKSSGCIKSSPVAGPTSCQSSPVAGTLKFDFQTQIDGAASTTCLGSASYDASNDVAFLNETCTEYTAQGAPKGFSTFVLETFVLKSPSGALEGLTYYREVSPGNNSYCQLSGGGEVYPQDFTTSGLGYLGDITLGVAKLEQWANPATGNNPLWWVAMDAGADGKPLCRPVMSLKGVPGALPRMGAPNAGMATSQLFANLTISDTPPGPLPRRRRRRAARRPSRRKRRTTRRRSPRSASLGSERQARARDCPQQSLFPHIRCTTRTSARVICTSPAPRFPSSSETADRSSPRRRPCCPCT